MVFDKPQEKGGACCKKKKSSNCAIVGSLKAHATGAFVFIFNAEVYHKLDNSKSGHFPE